MYSKLIFGFLLAIGILKVSAEEFSCSKTAVDFKCRLTTMTPYRFIANTADYSKIIVPGCEAKKIWLLIRHGTRYPDEKILSKIHKLSNIQKEVLNHCKSMNCSLNNVQLERLTEWNSTLSNDDAQILTTQGEKELIALGERFQSKFPDLMPKEYSSDTYKFKFTETQRTKESAKHFAIGLFGKHQIRNVLFPEPETRDPILRFYKMCPRWDQDVNKNQSAYAEVTKFKNTSIIFNMLKDMQSRFNHEFKLDDVDLIRKICAFETARNENKASIWCDFLTPDEFEIMEFIDDLKYYWIDGYGYELTYKSACTALIDMFNFMHSDNGMKTSAYFAHSGTLLKILTLLGIARDEKPLRHDNYNTSKDRLWRTSLIDSFATNLAFVSYDCKSTGPSLLVMHQERIVQLPGCPPNRPCPIHTMKNIYPVDEKQCNLTSICSVNI